MKKKVRIILASVALLLVVVAIISIPIRQQLDLRSLENSVRSIKLPDTIQTIAIKSDIGDSGGNGDQSTLRIVLAVKTELGLAELKEALEDLDMRFPGHFANSNEKPIFYVTQCEGSVFTSARQFTLTFEELDEVSDYCDYYFIEFIE